MAAKAGQLPVLARTCPRSRQPPPTANFHSNFYFLLLPFSVVSSQRVVFGSGTMPKPPTKRARTDTAPKIAPDVVEIDPKGDAVFKIGTADIQLMRVSGKRVSTVSKVFEDTLSPNLICGTTSYALDDTVSLPTDDRQIMEILFKMAHSEIHSADPIPTDRFPKLLIACDKYDCFDVFRYWLESVKDRWNDTIAHTNNAPVLLQSACIAHMFDDAAKFGVLVEDLYEEAVWDQDWAPSGPLGFKASTSGG